MLTEDEFAARLTSDFDPLAIVRELPFAERGDVGRLALQVLGAIGEVVDGDDESVAQLAAAVSARLTLGRKMRQRSAGGKIGNCEF